MTTMQTIPAVAPLDGLPKSFVNGMRTLFDIMDDQRTGYVKFSEIERRWQEDGTQGMPRGVLASLRKVTPPDGYLSFERFCAGLQISLLRNKMDDRPPFGPASNNIPVKSSSMSTMGPPPPPSSRPPSAPLLDQDNHPKQPRTNANIPPGVRVGMTVSQHTRAERTASMPHLEEAAAGGPSHSVPQVPHHYSEHSNKTDIKMGVGGIIAHSKSSGSMAGPPKPPRVMDRDRGTQSLDRNLESRSDSSRIPSDIRGTHSLERERSDRKWDHERVERQYRERERSENDHRHERGSSLERLLDPDEKVNHVPLGKAGIRSALQTWHKERSRDVGDNNNNNNNHKYCEKDLKDSRPVPAAEPIGRGVGDGGDSIRGSTIISLADPTSGAVSAANNMPSGPNAAPAKKNSRRREPRRHTLQNGIDYSIVRRLKQLEAERDMLIQGYDVVDRARNWYRKQLQIISEKIHNLPQGPPQHEPSMEAQQEKLHFQLARIHEVNSHLRALMEATERGLPSHMNLAIRPMSSTTTAPPTSGSSNPRSQVCDSEEQGRMISRLKDQNHLLTEEVSNKSERITALEREKAALLRELFQSRSSHHMQSTAADSTFM